EADEHSILPAHAPRRQPRATAVVPGIARERLEHGLGCDVADAPQALQHDVLLRRELRVALEVLQHAAAAGAEVSTARDDARRPRGEHLQELRLVVRAPAPRALHAHDLARESARDEHGLAVDVRDAAAVVRERVDAHALGLALELARTAHRASLTRARP